MRLTRVSRRRCKTTAFAAFIALSLSAAPVGVRAQAGSSAATAGKPLPPAQVLDKLLSGQEKEITDLAEAMPADKFDFVPSSKIGLYEGVSSFSAQVKHLANANFGFLKGFGGPVPISRADFAKITTRDQILAALKQSYAYDHAAVATITPENAFVAVDADGTTRAGAVAAMLAHNNDHYGQLVEYLRMNGIIPPASRR